MSRVAILLFAAALFLYAALPFRLDDSIHLIPPATNADGSTIVFAAGSPPGVKQKGTNLFCFVQDSGVGSFRQVTNYSGDSNYIGITSIALAGKTAGYTAQPAGPGGVEEVHVMDIGGTLADRTVATDKEGCIQPLCINCFVACVGPVHLSPDGSKVLYYASRARPFYVVNADGTGLTRLPIYSGQLAPSPQRVISRGGTAVFTSSAPSGPTFAAAATEVYAMNLDGTGLRQVTKLGDSRFYSRDATISADGTTIAFGSNYSTAGPGDSYQIWAVRADGSGLTMLSRGLGVASNPSISADGSTVTFLQDGQIRRARIGDTGIVTLTRLSLSAPFDPVITEDGTKVAFTLGPQTSSAAAVYRIPSDSTTDLRDFFPVYVPRYVNPTGVVSAAGSGAPSPGSLFTVYGANLGTNELEQAGTFPLPSTMNDVTLLVNGQPVPLLAVTPWQINAQLPQTVAAGTATFQVRKSGSVGLPQLDVEVKSVAPDLFSYPFSRGTYYMQATAFHAGTGIAADVEHPAIAGETLELWGAGFGVTDPMVDAGKPSPASPPARVVRIPQVQIGGRDATVAFAGLAPGFAGVYQVNLVVPEGLKAGLQHIVWRDGDGNNVNSWIAVK